MPLDPKLQKFTTTSPVVATYSYTDIAEGTGIQTFQGFHHIETSTEKYGLTTQIPYSHFIWTKANTSGAVSKIIDVDFDLSPFNMPKSIKGTARFNVTVGGGTNATANTTADIYIIAKIRKWDGSSETEIANGQSGTVSLGGLQGIGYMDYFTLNFEVDISTRTDFAAGETLRVTIELWGVKASANETPCYLMHDPISRLTPEVAVSPARIAIPIGNNGFSVGYDPQSTKLEMGIPFVLDV